MRNQTKRHLSLAIVFCSLLSMINAQCDPPILPPEAALYSWQFDGGLEGWTATNLEGEAVDQTSTLPNADEGTVIGWVWDTEGRVSGGAYNDGNEGTTDFIVSTSVCNGAMVFNSDFYDNEGIPGNFNNGVCPSTDLTFCEGLLHSPTMDLSIYEGELQIEFEQALRQFESEYYILLSRDGGETHYDTIEINTEVERNSGHLLDETVIVPLCGVQEATDFQFSILYRGFYYYWAIDDVRIMPQTAAILELNENFAASAPIYGNSVFHPYDFPFLAEIQNVSAEDAIMLNLKVEVTNQYNITLHSQTMTYDTIKACSTSDLRPFPELFTYPQEEGDYSITYITSQASDTTNLNDTIVTDFIITEQDFKKMKSEEEVGSAYLEGYRPLGPSNFFSWGAYFYLTDNNSGGSILHVESGIVFEEGTQINAGEIVATVYQWIDINQDGIVNSGALEEKIKLGEGTQIVLPGTQPSDYRKLIFGVRDENDDMIIPKVNPLYPEEGIQLLVMFHANPFSTDINYYGLGVREGTQLSASTIASTTAHELLGIRPRYGSFEGVGVSADDADESRDFTQSNINYFVNLKISTHVDVFCHDDNIIENLDINLYPSPANTVLNMDIDLDKACEALSVTLVNLTGNTVKDLSFTNVKKDKLTIDVSQLPEGIYVVNVKTGSGIASSKVSIMH